jgi:nitroreductase
MIKIINTLLLKKVNILKRRIRDRFHLELNFLYDYFRFKKHFSTTTNNLKVKKNLEAWILKDSHRIEKALSLPNPRYFFGEEVLCTLVNHLIEYIKNYDKDDVYYVGIGSLSAYEAFHLNEEKELPSFFLALKRKIEIEDFKNATCDQVGVENVEQFVSDKSRIFSKFASTRHSCRNFESEKTVSEETIKNIVQMSIRTPSVCNRQHWHVHFFTGKKKMEILSMQNGNAGFSENIPYLAVVTSDLRSFYTEHERHQPFIDGGLFSMSLMYSMHSHGLGSCPLNWCNSYTIDHDFHKLNYINSSETVIMLIAFGYPNPNGTYAKSPRMQVDTFYTLNDIG